MYKLLHNRNKENTLGNNPADTNCAVACERSNRMRFQHPISDTAFFACCILYSKHLRTSYWEGHWCSSVCPNSPLPQPTASCLKTPAYVISWHVKESFKVWYKNLEQSNISHKPHTGDSLCCINTPSRLSEMLLLPHYPFIWLFLIQFNAVTFTEITLCYIISVASCFLISAHTYPRRTKYSNCTTKLHNFLKQIRSVHALQIKHLFKKITGEKVLHTICSHQRGLEMDC